MLSVWYLFGIVMLIQCQTYIELTYSSLCVEWMGYDSKSAWEHDLSHWCNFELKSITWIMQFRLRMTLVWLYPIHAWVGSLWTIQAWELWLDSLLAHFYVNLTSSQYDRIKSISKQYQDTPTWSFYRWLCSRWLHSRDHFCDI